MTEDLQITIFDAETDSHHHNYRISIEELQKELAKFNLTVNQSKVYIFLGKYGSKTAPEVCKALKIARTETYHILSTLQSKGIVSATFEHPIRFSAVPLQEATKILVNAEKERIRALEKHELQLKKLWESIPEFSDNESEKQETRFQILQGANPINGRLDEIIKSTKNEILLIGTEKDYLKFYHSDFLHEIGNTNVNCKILTSCSDKTEYVFENVNKEFVRKIPESIKDELCFIIRDKDEMIFFTKNNSYSSQEVSAMWTNSFFMIRSMELLFNFIWNKAKVS